MLIAKRKIELIKVKTIKTIKKVLMIIPPPQKKKLRLASAREEGEGQEPSLAQLKIWHLHLLGGEAPIACLGSKS